VKKTVTALVFAAISLCAAGPLCAKTSAHKAAKSDASSDSASPYWQCVTFARQITGMQIFGDAWTWWEKATGKYEEGQTPKPGAVLVFQSQGKMRLGHVAVVSQIITDRYIQVTHANWSPVEGHRGRVEENVNVMDVSDRGDWSKVKVWYGPLNDLGTTVYTTYGFIYQDSLQGKAAARQMIAQSDGAPSSDNKAIAAQSTQLAMADAPADLPDDLKAALTPSARNTAKPSKAMMASAQVGGSVAHQIIAQIDADASDEPATAKSHKTSSKASSKPARFHAVKLSAKEKASKSKKGHSAKSEKKLSEKKSSSKKTATKKTSAHDHKSAKKRH
jgi:surface antigen